MNRKKAKAISDNTAKIITDINTNRDKVRDLGNKLLGDGKLNLEDIKELARWISIEKGLQEEQLVVCDIIELEEHLSQKEIDSLIENPIFVIYRTATNFDTFYVVKRDDKIICLYTHFHDTQVFGTVKDILGQCFGVNIDYIIHDVKEITEIQESGILALLILEILIVCFKEEKRIDFVQNFASLAKSYYGGLKNQAGNLKNKLFQKVKDCYCEMLVSEVDQLSKDTSFKKAIRNLTDNIPSIDEVESIKNYQTLLKKFVEINEHDIGEEEMKELQEKLEHAREVAFNKTKQIKIETSQNGKGELDIVEKFPKQMEKFTNIFKPLLNAEVDDYLHKKLEEISEKLGLDHNKVRSFFKTKEETKLDVSDSRDVEDIEDVFKDLPVLESKEIYFMNTVKPLEQLLSEIVVEKPAINVDLLKEDYEKVKFFYGSWCNKHAKHINQWAIRKKGVLADSEVHEAVAMMDRANEIATGGHRLRDTQILSILAFLRQKDEGLLVQIETGEGKTTIVSILAALFALQGRKVDVITSNPVLASDVVKDKHIFNRLLNLTVSTNNLDENYKSGARQCYKSDIVYGSINNFQFDYLKDSFLCLNTRGGRPFDKIILDEVDSMIIDNASHIAKLSNPLPGMESLKYVYINIWQALYKAEAKVVQELLEELKSKVQEISDNGDAQLSYEIFLNELQNSILQRIKDYIRSSNPTKVDIIPSHIQEYADTSLDRWINSAIDAKFHYEQDVQYVIGYKNGEEVVQPVDYSNTGITLKNTMWQYGLHQFLQLKHNVHLTSESLTSCFISNLGYINKYGCNIFGVTGTLGSEAERELLSSIYNVGYLKIPTFKEKKFEEIYGEVVDREMFCEQVADDAISTISDGRSALVICETIKDAKTIREALERKQENITIRIFFNEDNAHITEEEVDLGEVIIATNIAGRGTDLKTSSKLDSNGGLHVIVAFLPSNKRVEDQAFGRTARQGNKGTAKLIINTDDVAKLGIDSEDFGEIKRLRNTKEKERINHIKEVKVREIIFQDKLFELFSTLYRGLQNREQSEDYQYVLDDLKEFWAFWLEKSDSKGSKLSDKTPEEEFAVFETEAREIIMGKITFNPYYSILQAEQFILSDKLDSAEKALELAMAISKNPEILYSAYMKLFDIAIQRGEVFMDKCRKAIGDVIQIPNATPDREYKRNAKTYLEEARKALKKELDYIENILEAEEFTNIIKSDGAEFNTSNYSYWFSDEDMHSIGKTVLNPLVENINTQFINRLTEDQIDTFCKEYVLKDHLPAFICYNVGGKSSENSGHHWIGMCILNTTDGITLLYKDPKGDFANNLEVVRNKFQKHYTNLNIVAHRGCEQNDDSACGPMTLENLRIMAKSIKKNGIEPFIENFTKMKFCQQKDVTRLRDEFRLPSEAKMKKNIFIKHLVSRKIALIFDMHQAQKLIEEIDQHNAGISLGSRIPDYFSKLKPQNELETKMKDTIANSELSELASIGGNITYALQEVHDVHEEIVESARIQISSGIAIFAAGCCFPPALPVTSAISGTMISEGICDIAFELINKNSDDQFNKAAYVKSKVITYCISLFTIGTEILILCPKILNAAKNACRWMSDILSKCPYFKKVCECLATTFDKLYDWFERLETLVMVTTQLNQIDGLAEPTHFQKCISSLQQVVMDTAQNVTKKTLEKSIMNEVAATWLNSSLSELNETSEKQFE